jgi:hydroxymethylglutaryl-CoA reductase
LTTLFYFLHFTQVKYKENGIDSMESTTKYNWTNISTTYDQNNIKNKIFHEWEKNIENVIGAKQIPKTFSMFHQKYVNAIENLINMKFYFTCNQI